MGRQKMLSVEELRKNQALQFIYDAAAYLRFMNDKPGGVGGDVHKVLNTLVHDIMGIAYDTKCFCPRVDGYAEKEVKSHDV